MKAGKTEGRRDEDCGRGRERCESRRVMGVCRAVSVCAWHIPGMRLERGSSTPNPLSILNAARSGKFTRFRSYMSTLGPYHRLVPIPLSTLGGWHPEAHKVALGLAAAIASRAVVPMAAARNKCSGGMQRVWFHTTLHASSALGPGTCRASQPPQPRNEALSSPYSKLNH